MTPHIKLFTPGPVEVSEKTLRAFSRSMIGHRGNDFKKLYATCQPRLQKLFGTTRPVFISTSSAWGVMEGALRNLVKGKVLNCMQGAFSDKWFDVTQRCGYEAEKLQVAWGEPILPALLKARLEKGDIDIVTLIHNETSTGVLNPISEIAAVMKQFPNVLFVVDTVSSFSTMPLSMDELGIDVMLTGCQKALALPPGMALFSVSEKALARAGEVKGRGYYFDFLEFQKNHEGDMTPSTPVISHIYALESMLDDIFAEGLAARYARHARTNALVHDWVRARGFEFFAPEGYRSLGLTCVKNNQNLSSHSTEAATGFVAPVLGASRITHTLSSCAPSTSCLSSASANVKEGSTGVDVASWIGRLKAKYSCIIDGGYGKLKGETFRISNMGDETEETISQLLSWLDDTFVA